MNTLEYRELTDIFDTVRNPTVIIPTEEQIDKVIQTLKRPEAVDHYGFNQGLYAVKNNLTEQEIEQVLNNFLNNSRYVNRATCITLYEMIDHDKFIKYFENSKIFNDNKSIYIALNSYTLKQEIDALRDITGKYKIWERSYTRQYKISKEALEKLPPVMRVKVLQYFLDVDFLPYNIFSNISEDDFRGLLFGASLRHNNLINFIWQRYEELIKISKPVHVKWSFDCKNCGKFDINLQNKMIVSERILKETLLFRQLGLYQCPVCSKRMENKPKVYMDMEQT